MSRIYYTKPSITELEIRYTTDAAAHGWGDRCYEYISRFEELFKQHLDVKHAIATSSCTGALHMGMAALGIGPGDEVVLADTNWIASVAPITYLGATPVFVDVLPHTWCIDPEKAEAAITPNTKAIIAVHLYGNLCDMDALLEIGRRYNISVVEDAAEAIGSKWHGKRAGSMGHFGAFSFHGTKTITTGEGGMFVTQSDELFEKVLTLSNHGRAIGQKKQFWADVIGYKYKMSNVQAAIGCAQMERIHELILGKRRVFEYYATHLRGLPLKMNPEPVNTANGYWMPTVVADEGLPFEREDLLAAFKADDVDGRVFFWPLSMLPMFEKKPANSVSYGLYKRAVNLPTYHDLRDEDMDRVIAIIADFVGGDALCAERPNRLGAVLLDLQDVPVYQNRVFRTHEQAVACATGGIKLIQDPATGLVRNAAYDSSLLSYDADYQNEQAHSPVFQAHLEQVAAIVDRHFQDRKLIEVGCGKGHFMQMLRDRGFDVIGVDPAYDGADRQVIRAKLSPLLSLQGEGVILRHVLEYFEDPLGVLQLLLSFTGAQGRIYIETPNFDHICSARAWFNLYYEYIYYFRTGDLSNMFSTVYESGTLFDNQYAYVVADIASLRIPSPDTRHRRVKPIGDTFFDELHSLVKNRPCGRKQAVWGASGKGAMFAHFMKQMGNPLDMAIDINPAKQGSYLPGSGLQIFSPDGALGFLAPDDTIYIMNSLYTKEIISMSNNQFNYVTIGMDVH